MISYRHVSVRYSLHLDHFDTPQRLTKDVQQQLDRPAQSNNITVVVSNVTYFDNNVHSSPTDTDFWPQVRDNVVASKKDSSANYTTIKPNITWVGKSQPLCQDGDKVILNLYDTCVRQYTRFKEIHPGKLPFRSGLNEIQVREQLDEIALRLYHISLLGVFRVKEENTGYLENNILLKTAELKQPFLVSFNITEVISRAKSGSSESKQDSMSEGGSAFRITSYSSIVTTCGYYDHFNGNYTVY